MKTNIDIRADILKTLMVEDRNELRAIRDSIYRITTLLATASFAITAFLLGDRIPSAVSGAKVTVSLITDVCLVLLLWLFFLRLKGDLYCCRQSLVARQDLIRKLGTDKEPDDLDPFPDARAVKPDVSDSELLWLPILTTCAVAIKLLVICGLSK